MGKVSGEGQGIFPAPGQAPETDAPAGAHGGVCGPRPSHRRTTAPTGGGRSRGWRSERYSALALRPCWPADTTGTVAEREPRQELRDL